MQKLSGRYYFIKTDLVDAYNQIKLSPERQKRLALRNHNRATATDLPNFGSAQYLITFWRSWTSTLYVYHICIRLDIINIIR